VRALIIGLFTILGILVGSFLNVVIYRVPRQESVVRPRSRCTTCGVAIASFDNVPIVSWVVLRGRCRNCHEPISWQYPLVELLGGVLLGAAAWKFGLTWALPTYLVVFAGLLALSATDVIGLVLPRRIVYPTLALETGLMLVAAIATHRWQAFGVALACGAAWFALFFALNFASPRLMGFGDVRLAPILGLALGWLGAGYAVWGFFAGNFVGAIIGLVLIATKRMGRDQRLPYAVFLSAGLVIAVFTGHLFAGRLRGF
jgi:leader peptidase (prepilin peptidase)/N-methyltransferase